MAKKPKATSYTGRDGYIINQALIYAIAHIQSLPREMQEWSNMRDMCIIARESGSPFTIQSVLGVEHHTGIRPDLWPEPEEELSDADKTARDGFRGVCQDFADTIRKNMEEFAKLNPLKQEAA